MITISSLRQVSDTFVTPTASFQWNLPSYRQGETGDAFGTSNDFETSFASHIPSIDQLQKWGDNIFISLIIIAFVQALLALFEYRNNPKGSLLEPPGIREGYVGPDVECEECDTNREDWFFALGDVESSFSEMQELGMESMMKNKNGDSSKLLKRINKGLVFLAPWASNVLSFLIQRNIHLFHLGFFLAMSQVSDLPGRLFNDDSDNVRTNELEPLKWKEDDPPIQKVIVLGDSLAAGIGTVNVFEEELNGKKLEKGPSPVFPRVLAQRISENIKDRVHWRSAGIVGGDAKDVTENCLNVVQEETDAGRPPDIVVIICGINDLKKFATSPLKNAGPKEFQSRMVHLIKEIRKIAPGTKVILPSLPTQMFRRDSPLNIFPLVFFLNTVVGFWDSQKKIIASNFPKGEVSYVGIDPEEVYNWYMSDPSAYGIPSDLDGDGMDDTSLISRDGVHPNARCYAFWGASLGDQLSRSNIRQDESSPNRAKSDSSIKATI